MGTKNYEIIAANDASTDTTITILAELENKNPNLKTINFQTQMGKWAALRSGFEKSTGKIIITSDSDLQDNPKEVTKLLKAMEKGYDLVSGARNNRKDSFYKTFLSKLGSSFFKFQDINSPFKVYRRQVFKHIPKEGSLIRFSPFFAVKMGYKVAEIKINSRKRKFGKSKFGVEKYFRIVYDAILISLLFMGSGRINKK